MKKVLPISFFLFFTLTGMAQNVGIGITTPCAKLEVVGGVKISDSINIGDQVRIMSGTQTLSTNAGNGGIHPFGEYHRDNAIQAWAFINAAGTIYASYGISSVTHATGEYTFTLQVGAVDNTRMAVMAMPEIDAPPTSASAVRLISVDTFSGTIFKEYITNGYYALTDNDFMVIVTGR
jgi:hypothetical protein